MTFAQSALAPAKITRVSVTHHGEVPHLDVIVEDEQLSLAIGKRGQNVRLASELISCKIDIKSESDVKDEVAGALARMLQTAVEEEEPGLVQVSETDEVDWELAPGVSLKTSDRLQEAGYSTYAALLAADPEALEQFDGMGPTVINALLDWAAEVSRPVILAEPSNLDFSLEEPTSGPTMDDDEFMAALSKALQESEQQRESSSEAAETVGEPEADL